MARSPNRTSDEYGLQPNRGLSRQTRREGEGATPRLSSQPHRLSPNPTRTFPSFGRPSKPSLPSSRLAVIGFRQARRRTSNGTRNGCALWQRMSRCFPYLQ